MLAPGEPHPWRGLWLDMWDATQTALVAEWREIVAPSGSRLGLMSSGPEMHAVEGRRWAGWWRALAGEGRPIHRPHFAGYVDRLGWQWTNSLVMLDLNRAVQPADIESGPEIENSPHGDAKSLRQTAAEMVLATVSGADHLNISLYDYPGNPPSDEEHKAAFLAGWEPALAWLSGLFPRSLQPEGVGCPWHEEASRRKHSEAGPSSGWMALHCRAAGWPSWLGGFGLPFRMGPGRLVNAVAGELAWGLGEGELCGLLAGGLLLDGPAAAVLVERGLGELIGLGGYRFISQAEVLYSMEACTAGAFGLRVRALISLNDRPCAQRLLQGELLGRLRVSGCT